MCAGILWWVIAKIRTGADLCTIRKTAGKNVTHKKAKKTQDSVKKYLILNTKVNLGKILKEQVKKVVIILFKTRL